MDSTILLIVLVSLMFALEPIKFGKVTSPESQFKSC